MTKLRNTIMIVLILAAIYFFYVEMIPVQISAEKITKSYIEDPNSADIKYLNKRLEISGDIKSINQLHDIGNIVELENGRSDIKLYCYVNGKDETIKVDSLTYGKHVKITGICKGLENINSVQAVKINVEKIKL